MTNIQTLRRRDRAARLARAAFAPLLLAALAACDGDGPAEPGAETPSRIAFTYGGTGADGASIQGTYQAAGDPATSAPPLAQTYALGHRHARATTLEVLSNVALTARTSSSAWVTIPRLTVGSVAVDRACADEFCPGVSMGLELSSDTGSQARYSCSLSEGTLRITAISATRARGEFSGTGSCNGGPGGAHLDQFSITGGTFDVKVMDTQG